MSWERGKNGRRKPQNQKTKKKKKDRPGVLCFAVQMYNTFQEKRKTGASHEGDSVTA
jgi:hypothetical protein